MIYILGILKNNKLIYFKKAIMGKFFKIKIMNKTKILFFNKLKI